MTQRDKWTGACDPNQNMTLNFMFVDGIQIWEKYI